MNNLGTQNLAQRMVTRIRPLYTPPTVHGGRQQRARTEGDQGQRRWRWRRVDQSCLRQDRTYQVTLQVTDKSGPGAAVTCKAVVRGMTAPGQQGWKAHQEIG